MVIWARRIFCSLIQISYILPLTPQLTVYLTLNCFFVRTTGILALNLLVSLAIFILLVELQEFDFEPTTSRLWVHRSTISATQARLSPLLYFKILFSKARTHLNAFESHPEQIGRGVPRRHRRGEGDVVHAKVPRPWQRVWVSVNPADRL